MPKVITQGDLQKLQAIVAKALTDKGTRDGILGGKLPAGTAPLSKDASDALFNLTSNQWDALVSIHNTLVAGGAQQADVLGMIF